MNQKHGVSTDDPANWDSIEDTENYIYNEESDLAAKALERLSIIKSTVLWLSKLTIPQRKVVELKIFSYSFKHIAISLNLNKSTVYGHWKSALKKADGLYNL
jgi:DNA-binding NarL/FixJ family response regulator